MIIDTFKKKRSQINLLHKLKINNNLKKRIKGVNNSRQDQEKFQKYLRN